VPVFRYLLPLALLACVAMVQTASAKPLPPVAMGWQQQLHGDRRQLTLTVTPILTMTRLSIAIAVSGTAQPSGNTDWQGPLAAREPVSLVVWVPSAAKGTVTARITGVTASNVHFSVASAAHVPEPPAISSPPKPRPMPTPGVREFVLP